MGEVEKSKKSARHENFCPLKFQSKIEIFS